MAVVMIFSVTTAIFFLVHLMPGSPYSLMLHQLLKQGYTMTQAINLVKELFGFNPNEPLLAQYWNYLTLLAHGNLGTSLMYPGQSVLVLIAHAIPWTLFIVSISLLVSFGIGVILGAVAAYARNTWLEKLLTVGSSLLNGIPQYLTAILLFYFLAVLGQFFPMGGAYDPAVAPGFNLPFAGSVLNHAILPILAFVLSSFAGWTLSMKSSTVSVLGEDFINVAKAMGVRERHIMLDYVTKNAILPVFTSFVISIGFMFGGSLFVEQVFNYPGMGQLFLNATSSHDFTLMEGCFLLLTTAVILANLAADLLYSKLDPRIKS